jgi:hypothetical protein
MKLGTENKKQVYILVGLGVVAMYVVYSSFFSGPSASPAPTPAPARTATAAIPGSAPEAEVQPAGPPRAQANSGRSDEFKPKLRSKRPEEHIDPTRIDPTLRLDLLAKLQETPAPGGNHNLFLIAPKAVQAVLPKGPEPVVKKAVMGPSALPPPPPPPPPPLPPQATPINVKYYGWAERSGTDRKRAFFLDGDDVIVKAEGESLKGHYRVLRIGPTSVVVVDTNDKLEQTLKKTEDAAV